MTTESITESTTESVCPVCLARVPALRVREGEDAYLVKKCKEHGESRTIIWRGPPQFESWCISPPPAKPARIQTAGGQGCPHDCGLCPEHAQGTCCVLLEVTAKCDRSCPVCYASAERRPVPDPPLDEIEQWFRLLLEDAGMCNIQLSGGEPTLRDDLPTIISLGQSLGFSFFQLNTNGLRLATEPGYAAVLAEAGLSTVFMQFDGLDDEVYRRLRGVPLLEIKEQAIAECAKAGLGVVLVPTLVPGVNTGQVGALVRYAIAGLPHVRGVHFQPVSYFGRYPSPPRDEDRYTLPELLRDIETQTDGLISLNGLYPTESRHLLCSFHGDFLLLADGGVQALAGREKPASCCCKKQASPAVTRSQQWVARRWSLDDPERSNHTNRSEGDCSESSRSDGVRSDSDPNSLDAFLDYVRTHRFTLSAMAFQDAWTLDLERLRNCCLHVLAPGRHPRLVPFCSYNLTNSAGRALHRRVST